MAKRVHAKISLAKKKKKKEKKSYYEVVLRYISSFMQHCLIFELISLSKIFGIVSDKQSK
jgi:hypothetical protein